MSGVPVGKHSLAPDGDAGSFLKIEIAESVEELKLLMKQQKTGRTRLHLQMAKSTSYWIPSDSKWGSQEDARIPGWPSFLHTCVRTALEHQLAVP